MPVSNENKSVPLTLYFALTDISYVLPLSKGDTFIAVPDVATKYPPST